MNWKIRALATAAAMTAAMAAQADNSSVTLYGTINADIETVKAEGSTSGAGNQPSRTRVSQNSSNIGFRGAEDLGGGLKAIFQVEQGVNIDTGTASSSTGTFATRNSRVGLTGNWGTVFFGNWNTPYKDATGGLDPFYDVGIASVRRSVLSTPGANISSSPTGPATAAAAAAAFRRRENNIVQYWTPSASGFSGRIAYEANEGRSSTSGANPSLISVAGFYDNGPIFASLGYEKHKDFLTVAGAAFPFALGAPASSDDKAVILSFAYSFAKTRIGFVAERLRYSTSGAATGNNTDSLDKNNYFLFASHREGSHIFRATFGKANDGSCTFTNGANCSTAGLGAKAYAVGYGYVLSKRTELYALYTTIRNDAAAQYNLPASLALGTVAAGADPTGFGAGIRHTF